MGTWVLRLANDGQGPRLAVKDCIDVAGVPTTAGCPVVAEMAEPAEIDAAVVASAREGGARIVGKTGLTELCWSANGVNHWSGTPVNPLDPRRLPGGSSSGSAVAVATGEADVGFGTDTGGSVRIPAACCGITGLKTAYGRISVKGVYPLAPSLDTVGALGADVAAVELGMRLLEPAFTTPPAPAALVAGRLAAIGLDGGVDPAVDAAVDQALRAAGVAVTPLPAARRRRTARRGRGAHRLRGVPGQRLPDAVPEAAQPARAAEPGAGRPAGARGPGRRRTDQGGARDTLESLLADFPVLVLPTLAATPPLLGSRGFALTALTVAANLAGLPALSLPVPAAADVIASMQVIGHSEEQVVAFGRVIEAAVRG